MSTGLNLTVVANGVRMLRSDTSLNTSPAPYAAAEISALKPALLYGDHVELRSYLLDLARMSEGIHQRARMPYHYMVIAADLMANHATNGIATYDIDPTTFPAVEASRVLRLVRTQEVDDQEKLDRLTAFIETYDFEASAVMSAYVGAACRFRDGVVKGLSNSLDAAVSAGLVEVKGWADDVPQLFEPEQQYLDRASDFLADQLADPNKLLVFDTRTGRSLGWAADREAREFAIASHSLRELPTFSRASISEIIDIRKELDRPLRRFRSDVSGLANDSQISLETAELDKLYRREVQPALDEIDELTRENRYLSQLADKVLEAKTTLPVVGTFGLAIAGLSGIPQIATAAAGAAALPLEALRAKNKNRREIEKRRFYFLWALARR